jgi:hypothetical protein
MRREACQDPCQNGRPPGTSRFFPGSRKPVRDRRELGKRRTSSRVVRVRQAPGQPAGPLWQPPRQVRVPGWQACRRHPALPGNRRSPRGCSATRPVANRAAAGSTRARPCGNQPLGAFTLATVVADVVRIVARPVARSDSSRPGTCGQVSVRRGQLGARPRTPPTGGRWRGTTSWTTSATGPAHGDSDTVHVRGRTSRSPAGASRGSGAHTSWWPGPGPDRHRPRRTAVGARQPWPAADAGQHRVRAVLPMLARGRPVLVAASRVGGRPTVFAAVPRAARQPSTTPKRTPAASPPQLRRRQPARQISTRSQHDRSQPPRRPKQVTTRQPRA